MSEITRVKICGITRKQDAELAAQAGAAALGFVFYAKSPRAVSVEKFKNIAQLLPPFVCKVALFVNPCVAEVEAVLQTGLCDLLQFHGDESAAFCEQFNKPYIKAVRVKDENSIMQAEVLFPLASALLFDAFDEKLFGGTGKTFDWQLLAKLKQNMQKPLIVAGGLQRGNVSEAIRILQPWAVDVSGGVELIENEKPVKGVKSAEAIYAFMKEVLSV